MHYQFTILNKLFFSQYTLVLSTESPRKILLNILNFVVVLFRPKLLIFDVLHIIKIYS